MDKLPINEQEAWSFAKWFGGGVVALIYWLAKFIFGRVLDDIKDNKKNLEKLEVKIDTFIKHVQDREKILESKFDNFMTRMNQELAFQKHIAKKTKQRVKKNDRKK